MLAWIIGLLAVISSSVVIYMNEKPLPESDASQPTMVAESNLYYHNNLCDVWPQNYVISDCQITNV